MVIEWLEAVELAFLKGRHPLLHDIEVTFKPPLRERTPAQLTPRVIQGGKLMTTMANRSSRMRNSESETDVIPSGYQRLGDMSLLQRGGDNFQNTGSGDTKALLRTVDDNQNIKSADSLKEDFNESGKDLQDTIETDSSDEESAEVELGQVRLAAESVLKVLDVTMPGTLSEKKKEEVLEAVGRGETLVSALQEACPEDVREKMATAVSAAVQARGISLKLAGFGKSTPVPTIPPGMVENVQQNLSSLVESKLPSASVHDSTKVTMPDSTDSGSKSPAGSGDQSSTSGQDQESAKANKGESSTVESPGNQSENGAVKERSGKTNPEVEHTTQNTSPERKRQGDVSLTIDKEAVSIEGGAAGLEKKPTKNNSMQAGKDGDSLPQGQTKTPPVDQKQETSVAESKTNEPETEKNLDQMKPSAVDQNKETSVAESQTNEPNAEKDNAISTNSSPIDPNKNLSGQSAQEVFSSESAPNNSGSSPPPPSLDLGLAFEALTGVDDSTQMAVTNVFGVIENVLEQMEKERADKDEQHKHPQEKPPENGEMHKQVEQGQKDDPPKQSSLIATESSSSGGHSEPLRNMSEQLSLPGSPECPEDALSSEYPAKDYCAVQGYLSFQGEASTKFKKQGVGELFSSPSALSSRSEISSLAKEEDFGCTDLALEYSEDENVWKLDATSSDINRSPSQKTNEDMNDSAPTIDSNAGKNLSTERNRLIDPESTITEGENNHYNHLGNSAIKTVQFDNAKDSEHSLQQLNSPPQASSDHNMIAFSQTKIEKLVLNTLELELLRRLGKSDKELLGESLKHDMKVVSLAVAETLEDGHLNCVDEEVPQKLSKETIKKVHVDTIVWTVNRTYEELVDLPNFVPAGVLLGIILASLSPLGIIHSHNSQDTQNHEQTELDESSSTTKLSPPQKPVFIEKQYNGGGNTQRRNSVTKLHENLIYDEQSYKETDKGSSTCHEVDPLSDFEPDDIKPTSAEKDTSSSNMMGAMAAAVGATSALAAQENIIGKQGEEGPGLHPFNDGISHFISAGYDSLSNIDESKSSVVSTLAEKAMSVAAPVVPTKQDGEVDHERLVGLLAGLGQKGGILRFVAKAALLWGGLRGAMSLTDRLLGLLHISDRPLHQRILGFMVMVLLLWSPVVVPLIPTLLQQWVSGSRNGIPSTGALIGLYFAVVILINIWGKKIRGYDDPLYKYGIKSQPRSNASQLPSILGGLILGVTLLALVYFLGSLLQFVELNWAQSLQFNGTSKSILSKIGHSWGIFKVFAQCVGISVAVSFVEELFFRSWLPREIATDLGFHRAAFLSGLLFSFTHRSLSLVPGLLLLSYILTGVKVRCNGDLKLAIGIHAGLIAGTQLINMYGNANYGAHSLVWFIGHRSTDPFTGLIGISVLAVLALIIYPWSLREGNQQVSAESE